MSLLSRNIFRALVQVRPDLQVFFFCYVREEQLKRNLRCSADCFVTALLSQGIIAVSSISPSLQPLDAS